MLRSVARRCVRKSFAAGELSNDRFPMWGYTFARSDVEAELLRVHTRGTAPPDNPSDERFPMCDILLSVAMRRPKRCAHPRLRAGNARRRMHFSDIGFSSFAATMRKEYPHTFRRANCFHTRRRGGQSAAHSFPTQESSIAGCTPSRDRFPPCVASVPESYSRTPSAARTPRSAHWRAENKMSRGAK